ncbi:hypothetical protein RJ53_10780 [Methanocalculus chunghsingensis]|uniref:Uncharacterized protein n=1 Tax=Methanocalculus chunghsingensis TaxID=156457 RepID=A0A8J7WBY1_9EURY|nr:hypothetical protein [Methanocalculus chunghsingensis]
MPLYQPAFAAGTGIRPQETEINHFKCDGSYERSLSICNPGDQGINVNLWYESMIQAGTPTSLNDILSNPGEIASRVVLKTGLSRNGIVINTNQVESMRVPVGNQFEFFSYLKIADAGTYLITYWALYEGQRTEMNDISLRRAAKEKTMFGRHCRTTGRG